MLLGHLFADLPAEINGLLPEPIIIGLGHGDRVLKRAFYFETEEPLHASRGHPSPDQEEEYRRYQGKADKGSDQFGPEPGPENAMLSFYRKLPEAPGRHENNRRQEKETSVGQNNDKDIVGKGAFEAAVLDLEYDGERRQEHKAEKGEHSPQ